MEHEAQMTEETERVILRYQFPVGANIVSITIVGKKLVAEDFKALEQFVKLFRKSFLRASKAETPEL